MCRLSTIEQNAELFPPITSVRSILSDVSLQGESIEITGFVCSDISEWPNAHYWLVEVINGQIQGVYDSLKGPQHLTTDVGKKLRVTGLLLFKTSVATLKMCSVLLDEAAGKIPFTMRQTRPIKVHCRQKKIGYAPVVVVLAENDNRIRSLVCHEFGYRSDEEWCYTVEGSAALYLRDVHSLVANGCPPNLS